MVKIHRGFVFLCFEKRYFCRFKYKYYGKKTNNSQMDRFSKVSKK